MKTDTAVIVQAVENLKAGMPNIGSVFTHAHFVELKSILESELRTVERALLSELKEKVEGMKPEVTRDAYWGHTYNQGRADGKEYAFDEVCSLFQKQAEPQ